MVSRIRARSLWRVVGAAAVAFVLAAGPLTQSASAASAAQFKGMGTGYALRVTVDLRPLIQAVPALGTVVNTVVGALPGASMDTPGVIDQYFIKTTSEADNTVNKARSSMAEGLLDLLTIEANKIGQKVEKTQQTVQIPSADLPLITGELGSLTASVFKGPDVDGSGILNKVGVGLPLDKLPVDVKDLLGLKVDEIVENLTGVLEGVLGTTGQAGLVDGLTESITGAAPSLPTSQLGDLASGLGIPVGDLNDPTQVAEALAGTDELPGLLDPEALLGQITDLLNSTLKLGDLASITGLVNTTNATRMENGKAVADSVASLASLDVLGGLVDVGIFNLFSHSEAAGTPGSAKNTSDCSLADVKIGGGALGLSLDGKNIFINDTPVPVVGELVGTVKGLVDQVLSAVGVAVGLCDVAQQTADPAGRSASQSVSALRVEVAPLGLFKVIIDPTVQTAVAANTETPPTVVKPQVNLPKTGAPVAATLFSGIALAGGALFLRRRFS